MWRPSSGAFSVARWLTGISSFTYNIIEKYMENIDADRTEDVQIDVSLKYLGDF